MPVMMYRKIPVTIEAVQYLGSNTDEVLEFCPDACVRDGDVYIATLEGDMHVSRGDFVIRGVAGEFYPCKLDIFWKTYEQVDRWSD